MTLAQHRRLSSLATCFLVALWACASEHPERSDQAAPSTVELSIGATVETDSIPGLLISGVGDGSLAELAGLKPGDRIVGVEYAPTPDADAFRRALGQIEGSTGHLQVRSQDVVSTILVPLDHGQIPDIIRATRVARRRCATYCLIEDTWTECGCRVLSQKTCTGCRISIRE